MSIGDMKFTPTDDIEDLERFCAVAECLDNSDVPSSLRGIIDYINKKPTASRTLRTMTNHLAKTSIANLEQKYRVTLIYKAKGSGQNELTTEGKRLYRRASRLLSRIDQFAKDSKNDPIRVSISRMILSSIAPDVMREIKRDAPEQYDDFKNIIFDDGHDTRDVVTRFMDDDLDFAILWDSADRKRQLSNVNGGLLYKTLVTFDLLCLFDADQPPKKDQKNGEVSWQDILNSDQRVYVMSPDHWPELLNKELASVPQSRRVVVEDYSTMIRCLRMGMGGLGIAPALHRELDRHRRAGYLNYAPLVNGPKIDLAVAYRQGDENNPRPADKLLQKFCEHLKSLPRKTGWEVILEKPAWILAKGGFDEFTYSYYLRSDDIAHRPPHWRSAEFRLEPGTGMARKGCVVLRDKQEPIYDFKTSVVGPNLTIHLNPTEYSDHPNDHWVVVLNAELKINQGKDRCLVGIWSGTDWMSNPAAGPFILSTAAIPAVIRPLSGEIDGYDDTGDLNGIARVVMLRTLTNTQSRPLETD